MKIKRNRKRIVIHDDQSLIIKIYTKDKSLPSLKKNASAEFSHKELWGMVINKLLEDEHYFMNDFREITFDGAKLDQKEADHIIRFTINAWYDKNKRIKNNQKKPADTNFDITNTQKTINERNSKIERFSNTPEPKL